MNNHSSTPSEIEASLPWSLLENTALDSSALSYDESEPRVAATTALQRVSMAAGTKGDRSEMALIREATENDMHPMVEMGRRFMAASHYSRWIEPTDEAMEATARMVITTNAMALVAEGAARAAAIYGKSDATAAGTLGAGQAKAQGTANAYNALGSGISCAGQNLMLAYALRDQSPSVYRPGTVLPPGSLYNPQHNLPTI